MSSRMRVTKGHTANRRSHHGIVAPRLSVCPNCSEYHERHHACVNCGQYRGKQILKNKTATETSADTATVTTVADDKKS